MINQYLAKSHPVETIQEHTEWLIENYNLLKSIYPNLNVNWDILYYGCLYHDLGKMNLRFQNKIVNGIRDEHEIPHGILSLAFLDATYFLEKGLSRNDLKILAQSIAFHHERDITYSREALEVEIESLKNERKAFEYDKIATQSVKKLATKYFDKTRFSQENGSVFYEYVLVKGLLNRLDYAASAHIPVENNNDFLEKALGYMMSNWQKNDPKSNWNALQNYLKSHQDKNVIVIAQTGMGKTEAGLLWIGNHKGFFTLPLKTAINAMYKRICSEIILNEHGRRVGLLHSDTYNEYNISNFSEEDVDDYYNKTKQLSLPLTICTLDQIFDFVFRFRGFEPKLATLSYSKVVIDEIQMYSSDLLAYLIYGLKMITHVGGKFAILTATLPLVFVDFLEFEGIEFIPPKTFVNNTIVRHHLKTIHNKINLYDILKYYKSQKVLIICNTVKEAQRIYDELVENEVSDSINLFHSHYIRRDRKLKESQILELGNKHFDGTGIWVTTQVVEASLDIDFDILFTELSDLNSLFQRMGRCYRGRAYDGSSHNCYVFDGGEQFCSGVGFVVDQDIFNMSKGAISGWDGIITELQKMNLVKALYTTANLKETEYYQKIVLNLKYLKEIDDHEMNKKKVQEIFRNINSEMVIPVSVYKENRLEIDEILEVITSKIERDLEPQKIKMLRKKKADAKNKLSDFTTSVAVHKIKSSVEFYLEVSKFWRIPVIDCRYSFEYGVEIVKSETVNRFIDDEG